MNGNVLTDIFFCILVNLWFPVVFVGSNEDVVQSVALQSKLWCGAIWTDGGKPVHQLHKSLNFLVERKSTMIYLDTWTKLLHFLWHFNKRPLNQKNCSTETDETTAWQWIWHHLMLLTSPWLFHSDLFKEQKLLKMCALWPNLCSLAAFLCETVISVFQFLLGS